MATVRRNKDGSYTIALEALEADTAAQAEAAFGESVLEELVSNWLAERARFFTEKRIRGILEGAEQSTPDARAAVLSKLGEAEAAIDIPAPVKVDVAPAPEPVTPAIPE